MADQGGGGGGGGSMREYRKGNWTVGETMVLIEAKQMDDERRMKRSSGHGDHHQSSEGRSNKPAELRWKWVEDYCWRKGCLRSQNQCNDKWDNLMRDYKKVRDYERKVAAESQKGDGEQQQQHLQSYWKMEKNERKEKNLPSNMLFQIYEALVEVVEKKGSGQRVMVSGSPSYHVVERPLTLLHQHPLPPLLQHHHQQQQQIPSPSPVPILPLPLPPPPPHPPHPANQPPQSHHSDSDTSEYSDSPAKRRRRNGGEGTSTTSGSSSHEVGTAISKSASIIAEALQACEEREERRHKDLVSLHERRLKIEESKSEVNKEGINGLVDAINKLANSILALASNKNQPSSSSSPPK